MTIRPRLAPLLVAGALAAGTAAAYPLDGGERAGIRRLAADAKSTTLPAGARLPADDIRLHLTGTGADFDLGDKPRDRELQAALESIFRDRDPSYAFALVDITDPADIRWAGLREDRTQFPGSVGKVLCMAALFDRLAHAFPDPADRARVLRETVVTATDWAMGDEFHKVPIPDPEKGRNFHRPIRRGDRFTLGEWVDHMISASANSAGATVWKEAMLLNRFGAAYPPSPEDEERFFRETPKPELGRLSRKVVEEPLAAAGLDLERLRQGTMWTKPAQARVPGAPSLGSPRELARFLLRLEQGRLVDEWSSLEMKRFLYKTRRRYRYVYSSELAPSAVYFKSGSFFRCVAEEGFSCGKYRGNKENLMNSIAIVESPARPGPDQRVYIVALTSNVLRKNSAWDHARLGAAIEEAVRTRQPPKVREEGTARQIAESGTSD